MAKNDATAGITPNNNARAPMTGDHHSEEKYDQTRIKMMPKMKCTSKRWEISLIVYYLPSRTKNVDVYDAFTLNIL